MTMKSERDDGRDDDDGRLARIHQYRDDHQRRRHYVAREDEPQHPSLVSAPADEPVADDAAGDDAHAAEDSPDLGDIQTRAFRRHVMHARETREETP